jgi:hypothetical protein
VKISAQNSGKGPVHDMSRRRTGSNSSKDAIAHQRGPDSLQRYPVMKQGSLCSGAPVSKHLQGDACAPTVSQVGLNSMNAVARDRDRCDEMLCERVPAWCEM